MGFFGEGVARRCASVCFLLLAGPFAAAASANDLGVGAGVGAGAWAGAGVAAKAKAGASARVVGLDWGGGDRSAPPV